MQRVWFNATAGPRIAAHCPDLVVGVDLDGFALTHRYAPRGVAAIKGIIADELTYEDWSVRVSLGAQALCERIHVARVPLVLAASNFARTRLAYHYGIPVDKIRVVPEPLDLDLWTPLLAGAPHAGRVQGVMRSPHVSAQEPGHVAHGDGTPAGRPSSSAAAAGRAGP